MEERYEQVRKRLMEKYSDEDGEFVYDEMYFLIDAFHDNATLDKFLKELEWFGADR